MNNDAVMRYSFSFGPFSLARFRTHEGWNWYFVVRLSP